MKTLTALVLGLGLLIGPVLAADVGKSPIKIGDINIGSKVSEYSQPYKKGVDMAVAEINAKGGINGRPLEIISRDSKMNPAEAVRLADELLSRDKISVLMNCDASNVTLAVGSWALRNKISFVEAMSDADSIIWEHGNDYVFRTMYGGYMQMAAVMKMASDLYGDKLKGKRWAAIAPNYEYGHSMVNAAKMVVSENGLNAEWVVEQWPAYGKLDAGASIAALQHAKPDIILNMMLTEDLAKFIREGNKRGLFKDRIVIAPPTALTEHLGMLKDELPAGWISMGFPVEEIKEPTFVRFKQAYEAANHELPTMLSLYGYNTVYAIAAALEKAQSDDPAKIRDALETVSYQTPLGEQHFRKIDHQANVPFWIGITDVKNGKGKLRDWKMQNADDYAPSDAWILEQRAKAKMAK